MGHTTSISDFERHRGDPPLREDVERDKPVKKSKVIHPDDDDEKRVSSIRSKSG